MFDSRIAQRRFWMAAGGVALGGVALGAAWLGNPGGPGGKGGDGASHDIAAVSSAAVEVPEEVPEPIVVDIVSPRRALDVALRRTGIAPASLAAAGVSTGSFAGLLTSADGWFLENVEALVEADAGAALARRERDRLQRLVRSGLASGEDVTALHQAKESLASREAARDAVLDALFNTSTASLSGGQRVALVQIRENSGRTFPVHFLVEPREEATWIQLRDALANERIAPLFEDDPDAGAQSFLAAMRARPAVAQAKANHDAYLATLEASWEASLQGEH